MLRYASVPYLNARPLLEGLEAEVGPVRLEVPAVLVRLLREGDVDVALAPVVGAFELPDCEILDAGAIVAHGPVRSVLLFSKVPPERAGVVALDISSRTSSALTRVLFRFRWGAEPRFVPRGPDPDLRRLAADAALLIGDAALIARWDGPPPIDLGEEWRAWTGLPFVFAVWVARTPEIAREASGPLQRAAERGRRHLAEIARAGAISLGLSSRTAEQYLRDHLSFHFGDEERRGLERFRELWSRL